MLADWELIACKYRHREPTGRRSADSLEGIETKCVSNSMPTASSRRSADSLEGIETELDAIKATLALRAAEAQIPWKGLKL
jgi:hypothetical protein